MSQNNNWQNIYNAYQQEVDKEVDSHTDMINQYNFLSEEDRNHIKSVGVGILLSRDGHMTSGRFGTAVARNDLSGAFTSADNVCEKAIKLFIYLKDWVHPKV